MVNDVLRSLRTCAQATLVLTTLAGAATAAPPAPDADDFVEDFESYAPHVSLASSANYVALAGQTAPNGSVWRTSSLTYAHSGVLNNAIAQTGPNWNPAGSGFDRQGVVGGPDPTDARGQFLSSPRGSIDPQALNTSYEWVARLDHRFYAPTATTPVVVIYDVYFDNLFTMHWFRPVSTAQSKIALSVLIGGVDPCCPFARCTCLDSEADFVTVLGKRADGESSYFEAPGLRIKPHAWTRVAVRMMAEGHSVWVQNAETLGDNPSGAPFDAQGYDGEMFESGWAQVYPGIEDDPVTMAIEGPGVPVVFVYIDDMYVPFPPAVVIDGTGERAAPTELALTVDSMQFLAGYDPAPALEPTFQPHDWYIDDYMVLGKPGCLPDPAFSLPQVIDGEDLAALLADWGTDEARSDFDQSAVVDGYDLALLLAKWGACAE